MWGPAHLEGRSARSAGTAWGDRHPVRRGHAPAPRSPQVGRWKELPAHEGPGGILWALKCEEPLCVERTHEFRVCKKLGIELGALLTSQPAPPEAGVI